MSSSIKTGLAVAALASAMILTPASEADARKRTGAFLGGLAAGAIIGGAIAGYPHYAPAYPGPVYVVPAPHDPAVEYCMRRFRSYDPYSGTYMGYDGIRRPCP